MTDRVRFNSTKIKIKIPSKRFTNFSFEIITHTILMEKVNFSFQARSIITFMQFLFVIMCCHGAARVPERCVEKVKPVVNYFFLPFDSVLLPLCCKSDIIVDNRC